MAKAKLSYETICPIHGTTNAKADNRYRVVKVPQPMTKAKRLHGGCPICAKGMK